MTSPSPTRTGIDSVRRQAFSLAQSRRDHDRAFHDLVNHCRFIGTEVTLGGEGIVNESVIEEDIHLCLLPVPASVGAECF